MLKKMSHAGLAIALMLSIGVSAAPLAHARAEHTTQTTSTTQVRTVVSGTITEVNLADDYIMVRASDDLSYKVRFDDSTHIRTNLSLTLALGDVRVGDRVTVYFRDSATASWANVVVVERAVNPPVFHHMRSFTSDVADIDLNEGGNGTVTLENGVTVRLNGATKFMRRFGGSTTIDEMNVGDRVTITARAVGNDAYIATHIRDWSIWIYGVMWHTGEVVAVSETANTVTVRLEGDRFPTSTVTLMYDADTNFHLNGEDADEGDVDVGDEIRVRGQARWNGDMLSVSNITDIWVIAD